MAVLQTLATVDWLTVTATTPEMRDRLTSRARSALEDATAKRLNVKPWHFKGYSGWMAEHFRAGTREDSDIVMLSGSACGCYWQDFVGIGDKVTRIDLAVTSELIKPDDGLILAYWDHLEYLRTTGKTPRFGWTIWSNSEGGQTLYVGSRSSAELGRIYDKGRESDSTKICGKIWRYEVESHKPKASQVALALSNVLDAEEMAKTIAGYVYDWFNRRRIKPFWPEAENVLMLETEVTAETDETKLRWLTAQVRPTVKGLAARGKLALALAALELDGLVTERPFILPQGGQNGTQGTTTGSADRAGQTDNSPGAGALVFARD